MRRITEVRLPAPLGGDSKQRHWLETDDRGVVTVIQPIQAGDSPLEDSWGGDWISPRGIDLQINGGLGLAFPELTDRDLPRLCELLKLLWSDGVEAITPTLVTCGIPPLRRALGVLRKLRIQIV